MKSEDPAIQSACGIHIYHGAVEILALPTKEARIAALGRLPEKIRPYVEAEAIRIHKLRKAASE
jgi:hypothetical protein